jgi:hypothetical protein
MWHGHRHLPVLPTGADLARLTPQRHRVPLPVTLSLLPASPLARRTAEAVRPGARSAPLKTVEKVLTRTFGFSMSGFA